PSLQEATNEVQKYLSVRFPVRPLLDWLEATADLGQEGAQWPHQAAHRFRHPVQRPGDHGHECEHDLHHLPRGSLEDFGHQAPLP
ncbi:CFAP20, partial [Symbiodinium sp. CCMP2456]